MTSWSKTSAPTSTISGRAATSRGGRTHRRAQQCIRWNLFQLLQAAGRADYAGVPAKGLTGQTYDGHYFWDLEMYILPFLIYTAPRLARNLLRFRYSILDKARARARELNQKGALFAWRTLSGVLFAMVGPGLQIGHTEGWRIGDALYPKSGS